MADHNHPVFQRLPGGHIMLTYWPHHCAGCKALAAPPLQPDKQPITHDHDGPYGIKFEVVSGCRGCYSETRDEAGKLGPFDAYEGGKGAIRIFPQVTWFRVSDYIAEFGPKVFGPKGTRRSGHRTNTRDIDTRPQSDTPPRKARGLWKAAK